MKKYFVYLIFLFTGSPLSIQTLLIVTNQFIFFSLCGAYIYWQGADLVPMSSLLAILKAMK